MSEPGLAEDRSIPGATVVVPTLNRGSFLIDCIKDLLAQTVTPLEILVVDQSPDVPAEVAQLVAQHPDVIRYERPDFRGLPKARNYGWQRARYPRVIYVDDDTRFGPDFVSAHVKALELPGVGAVAGAIDEAHRPVDAGPPVGTFDQWTAAPRRGFASTVSQMVDHFGGGNFSIWRDVAESVGGVDEAFGVGAALYEETEFALRIRANGWLICFSAEARVTHLATGAGGCRVEDVDQYVYGLTRNRMVLIRRHVEPRYRVMAVLAVIKTTSAFAYHYRSLEVLRSGVNGMIGGWTAASNSSLCNYVLRLGNQ